MIFREDDLSDFLKDFGETAILGNGEEVNVIFDNGFLAANPTGQEIETSSPVAIGLSSDFEDLVHEDTIEIGETTYRIIGIQPDGTGVTTLILTI